MSNGKHTCKVTSNINYLVWWATLGLSRNEKHAIDNYEVCHVQVAGGGVTKQFSGNVKYVSPIMTILDWIDWFEWVWFCFFRGDLIANYVIIQNGISLYCTWLTIASLISLSIVQIYLLGVDVKTSGTICFTVLAVVIVLLAILENTLLEPYLANVYTSWLVVIWALSGNLSAHWNPSDLNAIFAVVLLAVAVVALATKIGLRIFKKSYGSNFKTTGVEYKSFY